MCLLQRPKVLGTKEEVGRIKVLKPYGGYFSPEGSDRLPGLPVMSESPKGE